MDNLWFKYTPEEVYKKKLAKKRLMKFVVLPLIAIAIGLISAFGFNALM